MEIFLGGRAPGVKFDDDAVRTLKSVGRAVAGSPDTGAVPVRVSHEVGMLLNAPELERSQGEPDVRLEQHVRGHDDHSRRACWVVGKDGSVDAYYAESGSWTVMIRGFFEKLGLYVAAKRCPEPGDLTHEGDELGMKPRIPFVLPPCMRNGVRGAEVTDGSKTSGCRKQQRRHQ